MHHNKNLHSERHVNICGAFHTMEREKWLVCCVCYKSQKLFHFTVQASRESFYWCLFVWRKEIKHLLSGSSSLESAYRTQITLGNTFLLGNPNKQRRNTLSRSRVNFSGFHPVTGLEINYRPRFRESAKIYNTIDAILACLRLDLVESCDPRLALDLTYKVNDFTV